MPRDNRPLPQAVNNVYRVKVIGEIEKQVTVTILFYDDQFPIGDVARTNAPLLFQALDAQLGVLDALVACLTTDWKGTAVVIDSPTFPSMAPIVNQFTDPGLVAPPHLPTQVAATFIKRTAFKGQCGRGRWSLPAVPQAWVTESTITTMDKYLAFALSAGSVIQNAGVPFTPIIYSPKGSKAHPGIDGVAGIISISVNGTVGTSRRRKLGIGI